MTEQVRKVGVGKVGCTGCGRCMPCPHGVDIPACFRSLAIEESEGYLAGLSDYIEGTSHEGKPSNAGQCVGCLRCERDCPQRIIIHTELGNVARRLEGIPYRAAVRFKGVGRRT